MNLTSAQLALVGYLIDEVLRDEPAIQRRWNLPAAAPFVRARAKDGHLLLVRDWPADVILSRDGEVMVIDTEEGQPPRPATESERRVTLFRSISKYPELLSFLPQRPSDAVECPGCSGTGVPAARFVNPMLRDIVCQCGGSGWVMTHELGVDGQSAQQ
jgi:hypothetical protein